MPTLHGQRSTTFSTLLAGFPLFVVAFLLLLAIGWQRFLAADEGFYLLAGKLVAAGKTPYQDFFYPQMPLLPYLHAGWIKLFAPDWYTARLIVCLVSALSIFIIFLTVRLHTNTLLAWLAGLAVLLQPEFVSWYTVAKTYPFETLPLLLSIAGVMYGANRDSLRYRSLLLGLAGFSLGCSVSIRLFSVSLLPLFCIFLYLRGRLAWVGLFLVGFGVAMAPHLLLMIGDIDRYWFNNLGYHLIRLHRAPEVEALAKQNVAMLVFGLKSGTQTDGFGIPLTFWFSLLCCLWSLRELRMPPLPLLLGMALFGVYFVPSPTHHQYFSTTMPLLILGIGVAAPTLQVRLLMLILIILQGLFFLPATIHRLTMTGSGVKGIDDVTAQVMTLDNMTKLTEELREKQLSGCTVIALWPGLLFATEMTPYPGLENQFWQRVEGKLTEEQLSRYHLINRHLLRKALTNPQVSGALLLEDMPYKFLRREELEKSGFSIQRLASCGLLLAYRDSQNGETPICQEEQ